jgi:Tfp pilus assembly protein PilF
MPPKYNLTAKELNNSGVSKLLTNENTSLKKSLKVAQDTLEQMKEKFYETDKENALLSDRMRIHIFLEVLKLISSVGI